MPKPTKPAKAKKEEDQEVPEFLRDLFEQVFERIGMFFEDCEDQDMFEEQYCDVADELADTVTQFMKDEDVSHVPECFWRTMKEQTEKHIRQIELSDEADELDQTNICEEEMELIMQQITVKTASFLKLIARVQSQVQAKSAKQPSFSDIFNKMIGKKPAEPKSQTEEKKQSPDSSMEEIRQVPETKTS